MRLQLPAGWPAVPPKPFRLVGQDEREAFVFDVRLPKGAAAGTVTIGAEARDSAGQAWSTGLFTVDYPHIRPRSYAVEALAEVHLAAGAAQARARGLHPWRVRPGARGAAARGASVTLLDAATLERGELDRFDVIVVGPRAYETDSALVENNGRLLEYARRGGLVIVQYQQQLFFEGGFAPLPMTVGGPPFRRATYRAPGGLDPGSRRR